jgi:hypothetical protein
MMSELSFKLIHRPHSESESIPWIEDAAGRLRRATAEEAEMWDALAEAQMRLAEQEAKSTKKR